MKRGRNQRRRQGVNPNRALDSNGPDVRIRGTANQIYDKYQALARDASSSGDRIKAENYLQHAEHYFRVIRAMQPAQQPQTSTPQTAVDGEGEQPAVDAGGEDEPRRNPRSRRPASEQSEPADDLEETSGREASTDETTAEASDAAPEVNEAASEPEKPAAEKKPRRRRAPRRTTKRAAEEAPAEDGAAAEEAAPVTAAE